MRRQRSPDIDGEWLTTVGKKARRLDQPLRLKKKTHRKKVFELEDPNQENITKFFVSKSYISGDKGELSTFCTPVAKKCTNYDARNTLKVLDSSCKENRKPERESINICCFEQRNNTSEVVSNYFSNNNKILNIETQHSEEKSKDINTDKEVELYGNKQCSKDYSPNVSFLQENCISTKMASNANTHYRKNKISGSFNDQTNSGQWQYESDSETPNLSLQIIPDDLNTNELESNLRSRNDLSQGSLESFTLDEQKSFIPFIPRSPGKTQISLGFSPGDSYRSSCDSEVIGEENSNMAESSELNLETNCFFQPFIPRIPDGVTQLEFTLSQ